MKRLVLLFVLLAVSGCGTFRLQPSGLQARVDSFQQRLAMHHNGLQKLENDTHELEKKESAFLQKLNDEQFSAYLFLATADEAEKPRYTAAVSNSFSGELFEEYIAIYRLENKFKQRGIELEQEGQSLEKERYLLLQVALQEQKNSRAFYDRLQQQKQLEEERRYRQEVINSLYSIRNSISSPRAIYVPNSTSTFP